MLKVAVRKLYLRAEDGQMRDISPLCVLDFYVHESNQRRGQGKKLFDEMLKREGVLHPARLAERYNQDARHGASHFPDH